MVGQPRISTYPLSHFPGRVIAEECPISDCLNFVPQSTGNSAVRAAPGEHLPVLSYTSIFDHSGMTSGPVPSIVRPATQVDADHAVPVFADAVGDRGQPLNNERGIGVQHAAFVHS